VSDLYDRFKDPRHIAWAKAVKVRDGFMCQICDDTDCYLHSHHCNSWDLFVDDRFDVDNGVTLCQKHHHDFHAIYGSGHNTKYQFEEFEKFYSVIKQIAYRNVKNIARSNI
jgi:hypothetical protein